MLTQVSGSGLRPLSLGEIATIAGGGIPENCDEEVVVTGTRFSPSQDFLWGGGFWSASLSGYSNSYQPGVDYCGSAWFDAPDVLDGVDISAACYTHDQNYSASSTMDRDAADFRLAADIYSILVSGGVSEGRALDYAMAYELAVRTFGGFSYEGRGDSH